MDWVTSIHQAIRYIEEHLREELTIREIAQQAALSPFYFQKGFAMLCGMTVGDYIRQRRLSAAGLEVLTTDQKRTPIIWNKLIFTVRPSIRICKCKFYLHTFILCTSCHCQTVVGILIAFRQIILVSVTFSRIG